MNEAVLSKDVVALLLEAPDSQLDASMFSYIKKWADPPTALQVLEVLDWCVHGALASGFVQKLLEFGLEDAIKRENTTYEDVVAQATWRK